MVEVVDILTDVEAAFQRCEGEDDIAAVRRSGSVGAFLARAEASTRRICCAAHRPPQFPSTTRNPCNLMRKTEAVKVPDGMMLCHPFLRAFTTYAKSKS
ncbi:hypothetical protein PR202_gb03416 [Eleusine coracana subsp. coracana]|uniref:Uncharacterized protein n=1 Tax=Eleusine coracana subsp. coracana TaxID=191504 RepID=A0AAV5E1Z1_ELECO|nr:hypothetical protein PR202_gb03416 [Eleusine coracana subsp. coracana]